MRDYCLRIVAGAVLGMMSGALGCDRTPVAPELLSQNDRPVLVQGWWIFGATRVEATPMWKRQYTAVAEFVGRSGQLGEVRWFVADSIRGKQEVYHATGVWLEPHTIVIAEVFVENETVVCHESAHEIVQSRGHEHEVFEKCPLSQ